MRERTRTRTMKMGLRSLFLMFVLVVWLSACVSQPVTVNGGTPKPVSGDNGGQLSALPAPASGLPTSPSCEPPEVADQGLLTVCSEKVQLMRGEVVVLPARPAAPIIDQIGQLALVESAKGLAYAVDQPGVQVIPTGWVMPWEKVMWDVQYMAKPTALKYTQTLAAGGAGMKITISCKAGKFSFSFITVKGQVEQLLKGPIPLDTGQPCPESMTNDLLKQLLTKVLEQLSDFEKSTDILIRQFLKLMEG